MSSVSVEGRLVIPLIGTYGASKWALEAFVRSGHSGLAAITASADLKLG